MRAQQAKPKVYFSENKYIGENPIGSPALYEKNNLLNQNFVSLHHRHQSSTTGHLEQQKEICLEARRLANERHYARMLAMGEYIKMGWLRKQGHLWKSWRVRFFVLYTDGTLAYYRKRGDVKMKGYIKLNEGIIGIQYIDAWKTNRAYSFEIRKGFYRLLCHAQTQLEAEVWVSVLRSTRQLAPPDKTEFDLTAPEERMASIAVARHLNKFFVTRKEIVKLLHKFKASAKKRSSTGFHILAIMNSLIEQVESAVIDHYHRELYEDPYLEVLPGNEMIKLVRRQIEDRVFIPHVDVLHTSLQTKELRKLREKLNQNRITIQKQRDIIDFGLTEEMLGGCKWSSIIQAIDGIDNVSLPSHKLEFIVCAGKEAALSITHLHGSLSMLMESTLCAMFRYAVSLTAIEDLVSLRIIIKSTYKTHPVCSTAVPAVKAFLKAIKWIIDFKPSTEAITSENLLAPECSRSVVTISTEHIGIQLTTDVNGRGAIVHNIQRQSQAALSLAIDTGLSLVAVNDTPVFFMPLQNICSIVREAALPKRLTFFSEEYYHNQLELDLDILHYSMCLAAKRGDLDSLRWLSAQQVDMNTVTHWESSRGKQVLGLVPIPSEGSPLLAASCHGRYEAVCFLSENNANPNIKNHLGQTPLHVTGKSVDTARIIQKLIEHGAEVDSLDHRGYTPLMSMCENGMYEAAVTVLALGCTIDHTAWSEGFTALLVSTSAQQTELVDLLVSKGADPNSIASNGDTALHMAARHGRVDLIKCLLNAGANPNKTNRFGENPIIVALVSCSNGHINAESAQSCMRLLSAAGCDLSQLDMLGRGVRHLIAMFDQPAVYRGFQSILFAARRKSICEVGKLGFKSDDKDIFSFTADEYHDNESAYCARKLLLRTSQNCWSEMTTPKRVKANLLALSTSNSTVDTMMETYLSNPWLEFSEVVSFIFFIDSMTSMEDVLKLVDVYSRSEVKLRGFMFFVAILLFLKLPNESMNTNIWQQFSQAVSQHYQCPISEASNLMTKYVDRLNACFSLYGDESLIHDIYPRARQSIVDCISSSYSTEKFVANIASLISPTRFAEFCTIATHAVFSDIPVDDFMKSKPIDRSEHFHCAKRWFQHLLAFVVNVILSQPTAEGRRKNIRFFLKVAKHCLTLRNFDTLAAVLYAIQSTAIHRLRRTFEGLHDRAKESLHKMQLLCDKGCRELNRMMIESAAPCMPYLGLYLQNFVALSEIPIVTEQKHVNRKRLFTSGELVLDIMHKKSVAYALCLDLKINEMLRAELPYNSEESRYARSLELEPRGDTNYSQPCIASTEMRESDPSERDSWSVENVGLRQWLRKRKVTRRVRARPSAQMTFEWVIQSPVLYLGMVLSVEQLGNGAAFIVRESASNTTILLGCGEYIPSNVNDSEKKESFYEDDFGKGTARGSGTGSTRTSDQEPSRGRKRRHYLKALMDFGDQKSPDKQLYALDAILISDSRPASCWMLPYLTEKILSSTDTSIIMTHATRALSKKVISDLWKERYPNSPSTNSSSTSSSLFDAQDISKAFDKATAVSLRAKTRINDNLMITAYHAGHTFGGSCFHIEMISPTSTTTLFYVNGFNNNGTCVVVPSDIPRLYPDLLLTSSRYAVSVSETKAGMENDLVKAILESLQASGKVIIPVHRTGFIQELMTILYRYWKNYQLASIPIYVTDSAIQYPDRLSSLLGTSILSKAYRDVLADFNKHMGSDGQKTFFCQPFDWKLLHDQGKTSSFLVFTTPANIAQGDTCRVLKALANDPRNLIVLSEDCCPGNVSYSLYADPERSEASKKLGIEIECGVHYFPCGNEIDAKSIVDMARQLAPKHVLLSSSTVSDDDKFIGKYLLAQLKKDPYIGTHMQIDHVPLDGPMHIPFASRSIPIRIHKTFLKNPQDVQGVIIAETRRKMMLMTTGAGIRRLKKPRHNLQYSKSWKYVPEKATRKRKKDTHPASSGISFLLSASIASDEEEDDQEQPQANVMDILELIVEEGKQWLFDTPMHRQDLWIKTRSIELSVTIDWQICINWSYIDEELAGRMFAIAKQIVRDEYAKLV